MKTHTFQPFNITVTASEDDVAYLDELMTIYRGLAILVLDLFTTNGKAQELANGPEGPDSEAIRPLAIKMMETYALMREGLSLFAKHARLRVPDPTEVGKPSDDAVAAPSTNTVQ